MYVWFGKGALAGTKDAAGTAGTAPDLTILGASAGDFLTENGALALGDVNGDGTLDLLLGARSADGPADGRGDAGEAYIVFGRKSPAAFPATLDLAVPGSTGADVTLYGGTGTDLLTTGGALAVGDVNGDGAPDLLLGTSQADVTVALNLRPTPRLRIKRLREGLRPAKSQTDAYKNRERRGTSRPAQSPPQRSHP